MIDKQLMIQCKTNLKKCGIGDYTKKCFYWKNNKAEINGKNLDNSLNDC